MFKFPNLNSTFSKLLLVKNANILKPDKTNKVG